MRKTFIVILSLASPRQSRAHRDNCEIPPNTHQSRWRREGEEEESVMIFVAIRKHFSPSLLLITKNILLPRFSSLSSLMPRDLGELRSISLGEAIEIDLSIDRLKRNQQTRWKNWLSIKAKRSATTDHLNQIDLLSQRPHSLDRSIEFLYQRWWIVFSLLFLPHSLLSALFCRRLGLIDSIKREWGVGVCLSCHLFDALFRIDNI